MSNSDTKMQAGFPMVGANDLDRTVVTIGSGAGTCSDFARERTSPVISAWRLSVPLSIISCEWLLAQQFYGSRFHIGSLLVFTLNFIRPLWINYAYMSGVFVCSLFNIQMAAQQLPVCCAGDDGIFLSILRIPLPSPVLHTCSKQVFISSCVLCV